MTFRSVSWHVVAAVVLAVTLFSTSRASALGTDPGVRIELLRGFVGLGGGIKLIADDLARAGIPSAIHAHLAWRAVADELVAEVRTTPVPPIVIVVGYSLGGNDAVQLAKRLGHAGIAVDLLVTFDPVWPAAVPGNVRSCINFYQTRGLPIGRPIVSGGGCQAELVNRNLNDIPNISHWNVATGSSVRDEVYGAIRRSMMGKKRLPSKRP